MGILPLLLAICPVQVVALPFGPGVQFVRVEISIWAPAGCEEPDLSKAEWKEMVCTARNRCDQIGGAASVGQEVQVYPRVGAMHYLEMALPAGGAVQYGGLRVDRAYPQECR